MIRSNPSAGAEAGTSLRRVGFFTTDTDLVVRSWDSTLERMTGIRADAAKGQRIDDLVPDLSARGLLDLIREPLVSGATQVLAPALHHYLVPCPPEAPSTEFETMQQRVVVTPLRNDDHAVGLAFSIEDVTARLERERRLARQLRAADPRARRAAIEQLTHEQPMSGLGPLTIALTDEDWQVRRTALSRLATTAEADLVHALIMALRDGHRDFSLLSSAIKLLTMSGVEVTTALIELLQEPDADLRIQAALALGTQRRPEAVDALMRALDDPDVNVRFHAIEALGKLGASLAVERLTAVLASRDFFLSFPALDALVRIGDASAVTDVVALLADPVLAAAAAEALGQFGDESAVRPLVAALDAPEPPVAAIVDGLAAIHAQYEQTSGAAGHIEDLVRRSITPTGANRILGEVAGSTGAHLRNLVSVLSWLRGLSVERGLAHLLGTAPVNHDAIAALVRFGGSMVDLLIEQLARDDLDTRRAAVVALGRIGDRRAVPALVRVIESDDRDLWVPAAAALARVGDAAAFEPLLALLDDGDVAVRQAAVGALNSIGHPDMSDRVYELLESEDRHIRESAVRIAGYFGYPGCADRLIARAYDADEAVRATALEHLGYLDDARVAAVLFGALHDDTPRARSAAARALAYLNSNRAAEALRCALRDPDAWVRYFAATSIGRRRDTPALEDLASVAEADPARQVRVAAIDAIGAIGGDRAADILSPMTAGADEDVAMAALRAVGALKSTRVTPMLHDALHSPSPRRRLAAVEAFAASGGREAVEALRWTASADAETLVSRAAIAALGALAGSRDEIGDTAIDALVTVSLDEGRRGDVAATLARVPASAIAALGAALGRPEAAARLVVVDALGRLARPEASRFLVQALDDAVPAVRERAIGALSRIGTRGIGRRFVTIAHHDESAAVRRAAGLALSRVGDLDAEGRP